MSNILVRDYLLIYLFIYLYIYHCNYKISWQWLGIEEMTECDLIKKGRSAL